MQLAPPTLPGRHPQCARCGTAPRPTACTAVKPRAAAADAQHEAATASRRQLVGMLLAGSAFAVVLPRPSQAANIDFFSSAEAEAQRDVEIVRRTLDEDILLFEQEADRSKEGKFCATPFGVDFVGITQAVALVGALVGGVTARQRKDEVEKLNEQLRKINLQLKKKLKAAPAPGINPAVPIDAARFPARGTTSEPAPEASSSPVSRIGSTYLSMDEDEMNVDQLVCREALRAGKQLLRDKNGSAAMVRFEKALMLSKALADKVQERRAIRGLAAAARLQKQFRTAIVHLERVLEISREIAEFSGYADVYGAIADCYTDLDEFDKAARYYDKYIAAMNSDSMALV